MSQELIKNLKIIKSLFSDERNKPAVVGLVGAAVLSVAGNVFTVGNSVSKILTSDNLISLIIVITSAVMAIKKKNPVIIICIGALLGIILKFAESIIM